MTRADYMAARVFVVAMYVLAGIAGLLVPLLVVAQMVRMWPE